MDARHVPVVRRDGAVVLLRQFVGLLFDGSRLRRRSSGTFGFPIAAGRHGQRAGDRQQQGFHCVLLHREAPRWINWATAAATSSGFSMMDMWPQPSSETWIACGIFSA